MQELEAAIYLMKYKPDLNPRGILLNKEVGGGGAWTSHQVRRQNLGQGPAKFTK